MKIHNFLNIKNVGIWLKAQPAFLFLILSFNILSVSATYHKPDFAFPQTVSEKSDSLIQVSLKEGNQLMALRGMMDLCISGSILKDSESVASDLKLFDSISQYLTGEYKSLAYLIEAKILKETYSLKSQTYESRKLPLDEVFPEDPMNWSGEMFKIKIYDLVDSATNNVSSFAPLNIKDIGLLLSDYETGSKIGLTIPDFIVMKGVDLLKSFIRENNVTTIPFYPQESRQTIEGKIKDKCESLLNKIINDNVKDNSLVKANAMVEYLSLLPDYEKEKYLKIAILELKGKEGEGILLYEYWKSYRNSSIFTDMERWLSDNSDVYGSDLIDYALSEMSQERVDLEFPKLSLPNNPIKGKAGISNLEKIFLLVYKLNSGEYTDYDELILKKFSGTRKPEQIIEVSEGGKIPYSYEKEIEIKGLGEGLYVVIPSQLKTLPKNWNKTSSRSNYSTFRVSEIALISSFDSNEKDSGRVYVVKGDNQQPLEGATVTYYTGNSRSPKGRLITNKEGYVNIPNGYYRIEAKYGQSFARKEAGFSYYPDNSKAVRHVSILTDLSIYRPGDTIRFAIVGWLQDKVSNSLLTNCDVEIRLRDANYSQVGAVTLKLDENGRANGELVIPEGRLLGNYTLEAIYPEFKGSGSGYASVSVEEYKLPAFQVTIAQEENENKELLLFTGSAFTYSGMPVSDADVEVKIEFVPWRWGYFGNNASYYQTLKTNSEGNFMLELPTNRLKGTIFETGRYSITAEVTSEAGETEKSKPLFFTLGKGYEVRPSISDKTRIKGDSITFNVPVLDIAGLPVKTLLNYRITNLYDSTLSLKGEFISPLLSLPAEKILSGKYRIEFGESETDNQTSVETVIWRENEPRVPYPTSLWIPQGEYTYCEGQQSLKVSFGSYWNDWLLTILSDGDKILETKWIEPVDSMVQIDMKLPGTNSVLFLTICGMHDFQSQTGVIRIIPEKNLEKMVIHSTSFRENISSGDEETWTFKFRIDGKSPGTVNAFAVMTDKALNALRDFKWNLNIWTPGTYNKVQLSPQWNGTATTYRLFDSTILRHTVTGNSLIPGWETYGYPFISNYGIMEGVRLYKAAMATRNAAMDSAAGNIVTESSDEAVIETMETQQDEEIQETEIRPVEMPVAFFMPDLQSNENGELTIKFKVPNYNTTWQFQLTGYNKDLMNASLLLDAVAAKQVMIKTNMPQFLRTGDKAEITATLYNNSDTILPLRGQMEVINPLTGAILEKREFSEESVSPAGNRTISLQFDVPDNVSVLAIRSYGYSDNHSDREQGFIPVLPSIVPVTESKTFYAKNNDEIIEIKVPKLSKDTNITLKYCDNPLWEVLLALPGFMEGSGGGSLSIARWLYGTLISSDIINSQKEIADGLKKILESKDTSLSISNLQKDESLKVVALEGTPWVNNASSETERIRSLGKYFERNAIESQIELKIEALKKLQNPDGGFSWFDGMKSSPYITSEIINILGYLKNNGLLEKELESLAQKGVRYYDRWLEEIMAKNKGINVISTMDYLFSRNMFGYPMSKSMKRIEKVCLDSIISQWRYWDPGQKAKGALVLLNNDNYEDEANVIASSLKQFVGKRMSIAQEALMVSLFEKLEPKGETIERICESMFLQKETEDWGSNISSAGIIHALVSLSSQDIINRGLPEIYVGNELLDLSETQALTGNFTVDLDPKKISGKKITIKRERGIPAWGGVISQFVKPIKDLKAANTDNLSVEKRVLVQNKGEVKETKSFDKGDKVTVVLNVDCKKDMDYVVIADFRSACLHPDIKISGIVNIDGLYAYEEIQRDKTIFFIENLPAGRYVISYNCHAEREGEYSLGIAEIQCLYSPSQVAHSEGKMLEIKNKNSD